LGWNLADQREFMKGFGLEEFLRSVCLGELGGGLDSS
jgi:hypothetical protein